MTRESNESVAKTPAIATAIRNAHASNKPLCTYGTQCYRRNPIHFDECRHQHLESELGLTSPVAAPNTSLGKRARDDSDLGENADSGDENDDKIITAIFEKCAIPAQLQARPLVNGEDQTRCSTWTPVTKTASNGEHFDAGCSKFGGVPYLLDGEEDGIKCKHDDCDGSHVFMFQLRGEDLPKELNDVLVPVTLKGADKSPLFQFWACNNSLEEGDYKVHITARWIDASDPSKQPTASLHLFDGESVVEGGEAQLLSWKKEADSPARQDLVTWGINDQSINQSNKQSIHSSIDQPINRSKKQCHVYS